MEGTYSLIETQETSNSCRVWILLDSNPRKQTKIMRQLGKFECERTVHEYLMIYKVVGVISGTF